MTGIDSLNLSAICCASLKLSRHDEVHGRRPCDRPGRRRGLDTPKACRTQHLRTVGAGIGPVVELALAPPRSEPANVRPFLVAPLELLGRIFVVPLVLLGDSEVDERAIPKVAEAHSRAKILLPVQDRADPDVGRALFDGHPVVLALTWGNPWFPHGPSFNSRRSKALRFGRRA